MSDQIYVKPGKFRKITFMSHIYECSRDDEGGNIRGAAAFFLNEDDAQRCNNRMLISKNVKPRKHPVFQTYEDFEAAETEKHRQSAIAKLTPNEKRALGLQ